MLKVKSKVAQQSYVVLVKLLELCRAHHGPLSIFSHLLTTKLTSSRGQGSFFCVRSFCPASLRQNGDKTTLTTLSMSTSVMGFTQHHFEEWAQLYGSNKETQLGH